MDGVVDFLLKSLARGVQEGWCEKTLLALYSDFFLICFFFFFFGPNSFLPDLAKPFADLQLKAFQLVITFQWISKYSLYDFCLPLSCDEAAEKDEKELQDALKKPA